MQNIMRRQKTVVNNLHTWTSYYQRPGFIEKYKRLEVNWRNSKLLYCQFAWTAAVDIQRSGREAAEYDQTPP